MGKSKGIIYVFVPVVIILAMYIVFYRGIESKPTDAGFWIILALGMSVGVALTKCFQNARGETSDSQ